MNKQELQRLIRLVNYDLTNNGGCNLGAARFPDWCGVVYGLDRLMVNHPYKFWLFENTRLLEDAYITKGRLEKMLEIISDLERIVEEQLPHHRA